MKVAAWSLKRIQNEGCIWEEALLKPLVQFYASSYVWIFFIPSREFYPPLFLYYTSWNIPVEYIGPNRSDRYECLVPF